MAVIKLGDLTTFPGDTSGSWLVVNNPTNTVTYKAQREQLLSGSFFGTASYAVTASYALNGGGGGGLTKFWLSGVTQSVADDETIVISDNYVLKNSLLILNASAEEFSVPNITFTKKAQIFIGGNLLLVDSDILNDGILSVAGALILSGSSTITGTGTII